MTPSEFARILSASGVTNNCARQPANFDEPLTLLLELRKTARLSTDEWQLLNRATDALGRLAESARLAAYVHQHELAEPIRERLAMQREERCGP